MHKKFIPVYVILSIAGLIMILPVLMMLSNSIMGGQELKEAYGAVLGGDTGKLSARLLPVYPTLAPYVELLLDSPDFFVMFWNSVKQVFSVMLGQTFVGTMAAWLIETCFLFPSMAEGFGICVLEGGMGVRQIRISGQETTVPPVHDTDGHALSGDDGLKLFGIVQTLPFGYPSGSHPSGNLFYISCIHHGKIFPRHPQGSVRGGESGRRRRVYHLPANRDTPWKPGNHLRADFKFSRILERSGSAYDIFKNKIKTAPLPVPAGNHHRPDGRIFRGVGGDDASGGAGVPMGKRLPAKRD